MRNDYSNELNELKKAYEEVYKEVCNRFSTKLEVLVRNMQDFIELHSAKRKQEQKILRLGCKLQSEEYEYDDEEDEDGDDE